MAFLVAHLATLPATPTGVDSVNFVLGVQEFDVAAHQPHAPGYPVFIGLGKASALLIRGLRSVFDDLEPRLAITRAVAIWSTVFGAIAVFALRRLFRELRAAEGHAIAASALAVTCPLFWFNGNRAMSDVTGLTAAVIAQGLIVSALWSCWRGDARAAGRLVMAAIATGIAMGVRSQVAWLVLPLLAFTAIELGRRAGIRAVLPGIAALVAAGLLWFIPMMVASGGSAAFFAAVGVQARDDVASGRMVAITRDTGMLLDGLVRTLAYPWADKYLAAAILFLAAAGAAVLLVRDRVAALLLALAYGPYAVYHLLFQDATFVRYALPLIPPVAFLVIGGLDRIVRPLRPLAATALVSICLAVAIPPALSHAHTGSPSLHALDDVRARLQATGSPPVLAMHHAVSRVLRLESLPAPTLPSPPKHEWLSLVNYWLQGGEAPVWFLAEPERTDLALIDPRARRLVNSYRLTVDRRFFLSGTRPAGVDWYELTRPGWFVENGWALTPESGGVAAADGYSPSRTPISAYVRREDEAAVMFVGGRHLDRDAAAARFELSIDGRLIESWTVQPLRAFLRRVALPPALLRLPPGRAGHSAYAHVEIRSVASDGGNASARTAVEQFDVQRADRAAFGFGEGWFEQEYDPQALRPGRWMSPRAVLEIHHGGNDVLLSARGEATESWLGGAATATVRAGDAVLGTFKCSGAFDLAVYVPAQLLDRAAGQLTIESDRSFVPSRILGTPDSRTLALRLFDVRVDPARIETPLK